MLGPFQPLGFADSPAAKELRQRAPDVGCRGVVTIVSKKK
jgi:hypothetical protein